MPFVSPIRRPLLFCTDGFVAYIRAIRGERYGRYAALEGWQHRDSLPAAVCPTSALYGTSLCPPRSVPAEVWPEE